jgi:hypothetical protein
MHSGRPMLHRACRVVPGFNAERRRKPRRLGWESNDAGDAFAAASDAVGGGGSG